MSAGPLHLTAISPTGELFEAHRLEALCGKDRGHPEARRAVELGRERALRAFVCDAPVRCQ